MKKSQNTISTSSVLFVLCYVCHDCSPLSVHAICCIINLQISYISHQRVSEIHAGGRGWWWWVVKRIGWPTYAHTQMDKQYSRMMLMWWDESHSRKPTPSETSHHNFHHRSKCCSYSTPPVPTHSHILFIWCSGLNEITK